MFKYKLLAGEKTQTIRPYTEHRFQALVKALATGRPLQIYWKQRTKECEKLYDAQLTELIVIHLHDDYIDGIPDESPDYVAQRDGFSSYKEMREWFKNKYKLNDQELSQKTFILIRWKPLGILQQTEQEALWRDAERRTKYRFVEDPNLRQLYDRWIHIIRARDALGLLKLFLAHSQDTRIQKPLEDLSHHIDKLFKSITEEFDSVRKKVLNEELEKLKKEAGT